MAINVQPLLSATAQILSHLDSGQALLDGASFLEASRSFEAALSPEYVPGIPSHLLDSIRSDIAGLAERASGPLSRVEALGFLLTLEQRGVWPGRDAEEADVFAIIQKLGSVMSPAAPDQMTLGASRVYRGETVRGFGLLDGGVAMLVRGFLKSSEVPTIRRAQKSPIPSVAPESQIRPFSTRLADKDGYLMVEGTAYGESGNGYETGVRSAYRFVKIDRKSGEPTPIAVGGQSRVFLGQEEGTGRRVAIKIVTIDDEDMREVLLESFKNEKRLQTALSSDEFVHVYSTGVTATGNPYIVMEFCDGGSLEDFIIESFEKRKGLTEEQVIQLAIKMVRPVAIAHQVSVLDEEGVQRKGVVHRDIKPANFMRKKNGQVKLGDFGLAALVDLLSPEPPTALYGTLGYFPPNEADSWRRDVYALASSIYDLITGQPAFEGYTAYAIMFEQLKKDYEALRLKMKERNISEALIRIVLKGLTRDREERHANAGELLFELATVHAHALEEEARTRTHGEEWREKIEEALREYDRVQREEPSDYVAAKMIALNLDLFRYGAEIGDDKLMRQTSENILLLDPEGEAAKEVSRPIHLKIDIAGSRPHPRAQQQLTIEGYVNRAGFLVRETTLGPWERPPHQGLDLPRDHSYRLLYTIEGAMPVAIPLPARAGDYGIRIPIYHTQSLPEFARQWMIMPAGPVAVKMKSGGSYLERIQVARETPRDIAMGPPVDRRYWEAYYLQVLQEQGEEEASKRLPKDQWWWDKEREILVDRRGEPIPPDAPVTHVPLAYADEFLDLFMPGTRHPTLDEWKRAAKGPDARPWPWGNALPDSGENLIAGCRHLKHPVQVAPLPNLIKGILDYSPFSFFSDDPTQPHVVPHITLNIWKFLKWPENRDARARMLKALQLDEDPDDPTISKRLVFLAGGIYDQESPTNVEALKCKPIDFVGPVGIVPVLPLLEARPTPTADSLLQ